MEWPHERYGTVHINRFALNFEKRFKAAKTLPTDVTDLPYATPATN